jgi:hypothetical protein
MGKVSIICVILVFALLLEDGSSVRKKTKEEEKEDEEIQKAVNATLAAEEEKKKEDEDEAKKKKKEQDRKKKDQEKGKGEENKNEKEDRQGEDCLSTNISCPVDTSCPPQRECPEDLLCKECPPCKDCGSCPPIRCKPCPKCEDPEEPEECPPLVCPPVLPCPGVNASSGDQSLPPSVICPEAGVASLSVPAALAIGAIAGLLTAGVATAIGLILRYFSPFVSGFIFMATIIFIWYLCSHHPETARELGGRATTLLREAAAALSHRIVEAIRHHNEQVGFLSFLLSDLSSIFLFRKVCTKIFYVQKINF